MWMARSSHLPSIGSHPSAQRRALSEPRSPNLRTHLTTTMRAKTLPHLSYGVVGDRTPPNGRMQKRWKGWKGVTVRVLPRVYWRSQLRADRAAQPVLGRQCQRRRSNPGGVECFVSAGSECAPGSSLFGTKTDLTVSKGRRRMPERRKQPWWAPVLVRMCLSAYLCKGRQCQAVNRTSPSHREYRC